MNILNTVRVARGPVYVYVKKIFFLRTPKTEIRDTNDILAYLSENPA